MIFNAIKHILRKASHWMSIICSIVNPTGDFLQIGSTNLDLNVSERQDEVHSELTYEISDIKLFSWNKEERLVSI